jgi:hypothetical protein
MQLNESQFKRQADIIEKEFGVKRARALEVVSKLNHCKNYHEAQQKFTKPVVLGVDIGCVPVKSNPSGQPCYEVKVKAIAEVKTYFSIPASSINDAVQKVRQKIDAMDQGTLDGVDGKVDWEVSYIHDDLGLKITDVQNSADEKDYLQDDYEGVEESKVKWIF